MALNLDSTQEELQEIQELVVKSASIPSGSLCRVLLYDIDYPKKAKEEARKFNTKLSLMDGLDLKFAVIHYFDEKDKLVKIIDYDNPDEITLPQGQTGFKTNSWFRCSEKWLKFQKFGMPQTEAQARAIFNTFVERQFGIPSTMSKNLENGGIAFNAYRTWKVEDKEYNGKTTKQYSSEVNVYSYAQKIRLTEAEVDCEVISPEITAKIITAITPVTEDTPF